LIPAFLAAIRVFFRSGMDTSLEVLALRQQVALLKRKRPRPSLNRLDRFFSIYTRKSTEEGLNQPFNTLEAQREAAEAYILSQRHLGWSVHPLLSVPLRARGGGGDRDRASVHRDSNMNALGGGQSNRQKCDFPEAGGAGEECR
jgi:hypothetical protein